MLSKWLSEAVFDFECASCRGGLSLDRQTIDSGLAICPACGAVADTADFREMLCLAEWENARQQPPAGRAAKLRSGLLH